MRAIFGLGNPGRRYARTRHNIGFMVLDRLAERAGASYSGSRFQAEIAQLALDGASGPVKVLLAKPQTYMNESGRAVHGVMRFHDIPADDILVITDDLDLDLGRLRMRPKGGSGGQKGLKSIIRHVSGQDFARLRLGIGRDEHMLAADYVLKPFPAADADTVAEVVERAADAAECWAIDGVDLAMNRYNNGKETS